MTAPDLAPGGCTARNSTSQQSRRAAPSTQLWFSWSNPPAPSPQPGEPTQLRTNQHSFPIFPTATLCSGPPPRAWAATVPPLWAALHTPIPAEHLPRVSRGAESNPKQWGCMGLQWDLGGTGRSCFLKSISLHPSLSK